MVSNTDGVSRPATKGETSKAAISHISAPPLEGVLSGALRRAGLPADEPWAVMHRIDVRANNIVIRLNRAEALAAWRSTMPYAHSLTDGQILSDQRELLQPGETLNDGGEHLILSLPVRASFRGGAATMTDPPGKAPSRPDMTLIKALARAHQWRKMLLSGDASSIEELAKRFGLDRGHVGLTLNLAFLSPTLARAIVRGE